MNGIRAQYDRDQTESTALRELGRDVEGYDEPDATRSRTEDGRGRDALASSRQRADWTRTRRAFQCSSIGTGCA